MAKAKTTSKLTENVVLFLTADNRQIFTDKISPDGTKLPSPAPKGTPKITILVDSPIFVDKDGKQVGVDTRKRYEAKDCYAPDVTTVDGCVQYLKGHNNLPCQPRSGYDSFVNGEGPTNPVSPKKFSALSTFRIAVAYVQSLVMKKLQGGAEGETAKALLDLLPQYLAVADEGAKAALALFKTEAVAKKAKDMGLNLTPEDEADLAEFLAAKKAKRAAEAAAKAGATVPAPTIVEPEDELEEGAEREDAEDVDVDVEVEADIEETV